MKRRKFISALTAAAAGTVAAELLGQTPLASTADLSGGVPSKKPGRINPWKRQPTTSVEKVALAYPPSDCEQWLIAFACSESNPSRVIIGQDMGGIWFSPNAGRKWLTLPNEGLGTINIQSLAIDPLDQRRWLAMCHKRSRGDRQGLFLTTDGGISWRRVLAWERAGETWQHCRRIAFAPSSKNPTLGYANRWYAAWDSAVVRYEPKYQGIPGLAMSDDGGKTLLRCRLDKTALGLAQGSSKAGAMHPDPKTQTLLLCAGSYSSGRLIRSTDNGKTWKVVREANRRRPFIGFDAGDPNFCYQCNERSSDGGATWSTLAHLPPRCIVTGVSASADAGKSVVYAIDMDRAEGVDGSFRQVWKSLDCGETWVKVIEADFKLNAFDAATVFRVHPKNPHLVYTRTPDGSKAQARVWNTTTPASPTYRDLAMLGGAPVPDDLRMVNLAVDPVNPEVMYVLLDSDYLGNRICLSTDGGGAWQDITSGLPLRTERRGLEVHPLTGVVYIGSGAGMFVRKPPYPVTTAQNTWDILDRAFPNWEDSHLFHLYAD